MRFAVLLAVLLMVPVPASAAETYGAYSRITQRSAGQYWSGGKAAGQWAWNPVSASESQISWGDPAAWPPSYHETFHVDGDWVMLDGWAGNGTYYNLRVTSELIGDGNCANLVPVPSRGGLQHYVKWGVSSQPYCLKAWGTLTERSSGKVVKFGHTQIWSPPAPCRNSYYGAQTCVKQWESWWDNNNGDGTTAPEISRKLERDQYVARGIGMAFVIQTYYPNDWRAELRYHWDW